MTWQTKIPHYFKSTVKTETSEVSDSLKEFSTAEPPSYFIGAYLRSANQREEFRSNKRMIENLVRQDAEPPAFVFLEHISNLESG